MFKMLWEEYFRVMCTQVIPCRLSQHQSKTDMLFEVSLQPRLNLAIKDWENFFRRSVFFFISIIHFVSACDGIGIREVIGDSTAGAMVSSSSLV